MFVDSKMRSFVIFLFFLLDLFLFLVRGRLDDVNLVRILMVDGRIEFDTFTQIGSSSANSNHTNLGRMSKNFELSKKFPQTNLQAAD